MEGFSVSRNLRPALTMLLMACLVGSGVTESEAQSYASDQFVKAKGLLSRDKVHPGEEFKAAVLMDIEKGYHINSNKPSMKYLIATEVTLKPVKGLSFKKIAYPKDTSRKFTFMEKPLKVYEGKQAIVVTVLAAKDLPPGKYAVTGDLKVQSCSNESCFAPATIKVSIPVEVVKVGVKTQPANQGIFAPGTKPAKSGVPTRKSAGAFSGAAGATELGRKIQKNGLLLTFAYIFLGGLALNLTPCVYPLIPITVGYFGGQSEGRASRTFFLSVFYVLGIAATYSTLGVLSGMAGTLMGSLLQQPIVLLFVSAILVALALSMFGVYEIQPPRFIANRAQARKGFLGALAMGLLVGLVAAPCLAPVLGGLLTFVAATRNPVLGFWMFFTLAIGMGVPYLFLGTFAGAAKSLPRSGVWLIWVKKLFGFLLLGATIYLLSPLLPDRIEPTLVVTFLGFAGLYLGWLEPSGQGLRKFTASKRVIGAVTMAAGAWMMVKTATGSTGVVWQPYTDALVREAKATSKPVVIDFYADWCLDCKQLDARTYTSPKVVEASRQFVMLKADMTRGDDPKVNQLYDQYSVLGLPTVVFLDTSGEERDDLRLTGFERPEPFLKRLRQLSAS